MKQYLNLLVDIQEEGTIKPAARKNMPGTISLFGNQLRHNLPDGFPLLTTKRIGFRGLVVELIWFLRGDTNIKFLDENKVDYLWHQDAYQYYLKNLSEEDGEPRTNLLVEDTQESKLRPFTFEEFCWHIRNNSRESLSKESGYTVGDCGFQYGKVWRNWEGKASLDLDDKSTNNPPHLDMAIRLKTEKVDQISNLIKGLRTNPESRRHVITAVDPANDQNLALYWCHSMFQFNCRPMDDLERAHWAVNMKILHRNELMYPEDSYTLKQQLDNAGIPKYHLDCHLYQRSADVVLGVPYNIASYSLLTHILAEVCNMIPGEFIHSFGDVHIYDNHQDAVQEQLTRTPTELPILMFNDEFKAMCLGFRNGEVTPEQLLYNLKPEHFALEGYVPQAKIEAELSTGMTKK